MADMHAFLATMPDEYRATFDDAAIAAHAVIVESRGDKGSVTAEWDDGRRDRDETTALCIVADDSPGLFARITAALVAHDIDIVAAEAFNRARADGRVEAVDFLWVKRVDGRLADRDVVAIATLIDTLVRGDTKWVPSEKPPAPRRRRSSGGITRVKFDRDEKTGGTILTIEAADRPGLLLAITKTIFVAKLQIVGLHAKSERGRAIDRFHVAELVDTPMTTERVLELQSAILEAIDITSADRSSEPSIPTALNPGRRATS